MERVNLTVIAHTFSTGLGVAKTEHLPPEQTGLSLRLLVANQPWSQGRIPFYVVRSQEFVCTPTADGVRHVVIRQGIFEAKKTLAPGTASDHGNRAFSFRDG
jgi:hypothetical protein